MKRICSLLLCVLLIFSCAGAAFAADADGTDIPTVYVVGTGAGLKVVNPDGSKRVVFPIQIPEDFIETQVKGNLDVFKKAFFTQKWDEFCVVLHDVMAPLFAEIRLDEHGEAPNGSVVDWDWGWIDGRRVGGKYPTDRFQYHYDWRMDPYKTAEGLHSYIEAVRAATGEEKVNLIGRCLGACITAAYMEKYDGEYVQNYLLYCGALYGATQCTKAFSGELYLESGGIERFTYDLELFADEVLMDLLQSAATLLRKTGGLDIAAWAVNNVYRQIYLKVVPPILSETYGTFPGWWSMVADRDYEKAKQTVFYGADMNKWQGFLDILDNYHYNVQTRTPELFAHYRAKGISLANVVKYGYQTIPVTRESDMLSDQLCRVEDASFGATAATINGTLKKSYLKTADSRFISPDKQIDASTCLLPERTWFIKNLAHKDFPDDVNHLFDAILNDPALTVFDREELPQYLVYNDSTEQLEPMNAENMDTTGRYRQSFFRALRIFLHAVRVLLERYIQAKRAGA